MDRRNGRGLQSHFWVFLVTDLCCLIARGMGDAIPNFADQQPDIGESDLRVGTATAAGAAVLAGLPNGEPGLTSSTISMRMRMRKRARVERVIEAFIE